MAYKFQVGSATLSGSVTVEKELTAQHDIESSAGQVKVGAASNFQIGNAWLTKGAVQPLLDVTGGTAKKNKVLVLDSGKRVSGLQSITASNFSGSFKGNGNGIYGVSADTAVVDKSDNANYSLVGVAAAASAATLICDDDANFTFNPSTKRVNLPGKLAVTGNVDLAAKLQLSGAADLGTNTADIIKVFGQLTASLGIDLNEKGLKNVGEVKCDSVASDTAGTGLDISFDGNTGTNKISLTDNLADALNINQGGNTYLQFITTNDEEAILAGEQFAVSASDGPNGISIKTNGYQIFEGFKNVTSSFDMAAGGSNPVHELKHSHYLMSASSGTVTLTLPDVSEDSHGGPGSGTWIHVKRHGGATNGTYKISPSGSTKIDYSTADVELESEGAAVLLYGIKGNWHIW